MEPTQLFLLFVAVLSAVTVFFRPVTIISEGGLMYSLAAYADDAAREPEYENMPYFVPTFMNPEEVTANV